MFGLQKFHRYVYGRHFTLITDNKALSGIFDDKTAFPALAAARLVQWSVALCAYRYGIECKLTTPHANADMISYLPLQSECNATLNNIKRCF